MGKSKRQKLQSGPKKQKHNGTVKGARPTGIMKPNTAKKFTSKPHIQAQHLLPTIPFASTDRILLIGDGDLSFARSLVEQHTCTNVTATVYESREELEGKYPNIGENVQVLEDKGANVVYGVDATKVKGKAGLGGVGIGMMDRVFFNFPHVGGKSTDVNRQVRYNQGTISISQAVYQLLILAAELLVSFFQNAMPALAPSTAGSTSSIIVTLFEGEPYTLWNIRDLARHSGLQVEKSFKFQAKAYPGYKHARTLGVVKGKNGEVGGGWRGEERAARSFVFVRKGEAPAPAANASGKGHQSSEEEEDGFDIDPEEEEEFEGVDQHEDDGPENDEN
jgi:25S rRNA (uracil2634-N3)-methyltransferase